jgi:hypothetical protein
MAEDVMDQIEKLTEEIQRAWPELSG